ncbi:uncharacterized protein LOC125225452 [Leguminivora glycinivorella]|uniref:uncharacterized protein LOC125225452 n=1 Tax=Leguminivora glycinivorella TaxID=1035111 RepID=UPI00200D8721|nr:uncharacterized protein LOC125225452 [Leguminivora glycinivorella]
MTFYTYLFMTNVLMVIVIRYCNSFDLVRRENENVRKSEYYDKAIRPVLQACALEWDRWGVRALDLRLYSSKPHLYPQFDNDVYDCVWGCFFLRMGWVSVCWARWGRGVRQRHLRLRLGLLLPAHGLGERVLGSVGEGRWGVRALDLRLYSSKPHLYPQFDNDVYDCVWGCFFLRMGWLDDLEGWFNPAVVVEEMDKYLEHWRIPRITLMTSRCIYVNYPHSPLDGPVPDCEQARLLKECLISEDVQDVTARNKAQLIDTLVSWLRVCADLEGLPLHAVLARAARPPRVSPPHGDPAPPALQGCVWCCLFVDMGWMDDDHGFFILPVMSEMIRMYYYKTDLIPQLIKETTECAEAANRFHENPDIDTRPHGCDRSQLFVDCLVNNFFNKLKSPWFTKKKMIISMRADNSSSSPAPRRRARWRPPPRVRLRARLAPDDSIFVQVKVAATRT